MILPESLKRTFWDELKTYEEDRKMPYITSVEEIGYDRGLEQGERSLVLRQLDYKFGELSASISDQIKSLSLPKIEALSKALLDFTSIEDLTGWLKKH